MRALTSSCCSCARARADERGGADGQDNIRAIPYNRVFAQYFIGSQSAAGKMYPWLHQQAIDEGLHNLTEAPAAATACEYMSLTRSSFAGGQRFCSYLWSGDTISRFDVLLQQVRACLNMWRGSVRC